MLAEDLAERRQRRPVALWAMDEHRVGLKPMLRRVGAKKRQRPHVRVRPRSEWLYVYAFVCPETSETEFWLATGANTEPFTRILTALLRAREWAVLLVLDQAGWHVSEPTLAIEGEALELMHLPPYARSFSRPSGCGNSSTSRWRTRSSGGGRIWRRRWPIGAWR